MSTLIELQGNAAADAQTLVALLQGKDVGLEPVERPDEDRNLGDVAIEFGVVFLAHASAGVVHDLVRGWLNDRGHRVEDATVKPAEEHAEEEEADGGGESGADSSPEEHA